MRLKTVFTRFYKSFNDDFLRRLNRKAQPKPWEKIDKDWYPYVEVPIDSKITTIVGANESGKSHLLSAVEKAISGKNIERDDFCRYSKFFTVKRGELKYPDFGTEWIDLIEEEKTFFRAACDMPDGYKFDCLLIFRTNTDNLTVYVPEKGDYRSYKIKEDYIQKVPGVLPSTFRIDAEIALPDTIPIAKLIDPLNYDGSGKFEFLEHDDKLRVLNLLDDLTLNPKPIRTIPPNNSESSPFDKTISSIISVLNQSNLNLDRKDRQTKELELARKLIYKIAQIDPEALIDLAESLKKGKQGYANGIVKMINDQLARNLNFPNWWVQDRNFSLKLMARDHDLVFTISDRTGTEYSFRERSSGLKYFLSYYIQYRSHESHKEKNEILLMDEPDTYLSSQAQQDLLRIFEAFATPEEGSHIARPIQVVYVTHSPFLIDKNHSERIRVLQKGNEDEGTRIVKDAAKNHYEPLRSAFGAFVGETTFIGNCNLMVEGMADQILLAGTAAYLRTHNVSSLETLDLNNITIVPAGSASHIPYLVYLARGRDVEQPAVVVLLDSDNSGNEAKKQLLGKGGQHRRPLLKENFILQIGDLDVDLTTPNSIKPIEIEDLIPLPICVEAVKRYLVEICRIDKNITENIISEAALLKKLTDSRTVFDSIEACLEEVAEFDFHIEKVGFARNVIGIVYELRRKEERTSQAISDEALKIFEQNFKSLFIKLNRMQRQAQQKTIRERLSEKLNRSKETFLQRHPVMARREDAIAFLQDIENILDDNLDSDSYIEFDEIRKIIQNLRNVYKLELQFDVTKHIDDYEGFKIGLEQIKYAGRLATQEDETFLDLGTDPKLDKRLSANSEIEVPESASKTKINEIPNAKNQSLKHKQAPSQPAQAE